MLLEEENEIFAFNMTMELEALREQEDADPLMAYAASADPDTMYWHEAMREPDRDKFIEAAQKEIDDHLDSETFEVMRRSDLPEGAAVMPAVWQMKRKRDIKTQEVYKWKGRINIDGSKQIKGVNYWDTYAPVAAWPTIRMILAMALKEGWETRQIDYVLAFTQAEAERDDMYMQIPKGLRCRRRRSQGLCPTSEEEPLWAEASRTSMEPALDKEVAGDWFQAER